MFGRKTGGDGDEECILCDTVMAIAGGLVGLVLIAVAFDLISKGAISGRIAARFDGEASGE